MNARPPRPFPLGELAPYPTAVQQELPPNYWRAGRHLRRLVLRDRLGEYPNSAGLPVLYDSTQTGIL